MNTSIFLRRLFEGYVKNFRSFNWHVSSNYADITSAELNHFSLIGKSLGYLVRREMNWNYPRDLCWVLGENNDKEAYLYLERENKDSRMLHTIKKMLERDNSKDIHILVASFGHLKPESFVAASELLRNGILNHQSALLFAWIGENENSSEFSVKAHIVTSENVEEYEAIPYIGKDGYWNIELTYEQSQEQV